MTTEEQRLDPNYIPELFARDTMGRIKSWKVTVESDGYTVEYGLLNSANMQEKFTPTVGKNIGKANETSAFDQAISEAKSKWNSHWDKGYRPSVIESDNAPKRPQGCQDFRKAGHNMVFPCSAQRKLNGVRAYFTAQRTQQVMDEILWEIKAWTRNLKEWKIPPLIKEQLFLLIVECPYLPECFDGEFYRHGWHLQDIVSHAKRHHNEDKEQTYRKTVDELVLHIFDLPHPTRSAGERMWQLSKLKKWVEERQERFPNIYIEDDFIVKDREQMKVLHDEVTAEGYEGLVLRDPNGKYTYGSKVRNMMKYKEFIDEEFKIVDTLVDKDGYGLFWCEIEVVKGITKRFKVEPIGPKEDRLDIVENPQNYIGKMLTVKFFEYTKHGIPEFPKGLVVRDYE